MKTTAQKQCAATPLPSKGRGRGGVSRSFTVRTFLDKLSGKTDYRPHPQPLPLRGGECSGERPGDFRERLGNFRERLGNFRERLGEICERLGNFRERLGEIRERLGEIRERLGNFRERLGEIRERLGEIRERLGEIRERAADRQRVGYVWVPVWVRHGARRCKCLIISGGV